MCRISWHRDSEINGGAPIFEVLKLTKTKWPNKCKSYNHGVAKGGALPSLEILIASHLPWSKALEVRFTSLQLFVLGAQIC